MHFPGGDSKLTELVLLITHTQPACNIQHHPLALTTVGC